MPVCFYQTIIECKGIDHELGDRLVPDRIRLVVEDMDAAIADLEKIDVAGSERGALDAAAHRW